MPSRSMRALFQMRQDSPSFFDSRAAARAKVTGLRSLGGALTRSRAKLMLSAIVPDRGLAISGRVLDAETLQPLPGARVKCKPASVGGHSSKQAGDGREVLGGERIVPALGDGCQSGHEASPLWMMA